MNRVTRDLARIAIAVGGLFAIGALAGAPALAAVPQQPVAMASCFHHHHHHHGSYPPKLTGASATTTTVKQGGSDTVSGSGFCAGELVDFTLHSTPVHLTTARASSSGSVSATVVIPADTVPGQHEFVLTGEQSGVTETVPVTVTAAVASTQSGSSLPFTGAGELRPMIGSGLGLIVAGTLLLLVVRRWRRALPE